MDESKSDVGSDMNDMHMGISESETMYSSYESEYEGLFKSILDQHLE